MLRLREILTVEDIRSDTHMIHANKPFQVIKKIQIDPERGLRRRLRRRYGCAALPSVSYSTS